MAERLSIPSKEVALRIVGPRDAFTASRIQRVTLTNDVPSTDVFELGNPLQTGAVKDVPNITLTFAAMDVGIKVFSVLTGNDATAYPGAGVDISDLDEIDAIIYIKDAVVSDYVKTGHARRLQVRDFSFTYSVDGESEESYTAIGSKKRWFKNDVVVDKFTTGTDQFTLTETPIQLKNGDYGLSVILDGDYLTEVSVAPATGEYQITGTTLDTGDTRTAQVLAVYHASPAGTNWTDVSDATLPVAIRGSDAVVEIAANAITRIQNITINGTLNATPVREMGNRAIVGYQKQVATVDGTLTVLDTDTDLVDLLVTGSTESGDTEFEFGSECTTSGISLQIELRDPCEDEDSATVLKTIYIPTIEITGDTFTSNVNNDATLTFNWKSSDAQCIVYSGAKP